MTPRLLRCGRLALLVALATSCASPSELGGVVEDRMFQPLPSREPRRSQELDSAFNITRVEVREAGGALEVALECEAAGDERHGFGLHFDADRDGEGEAWVFVRPDGATLTDNRLKLLAEAPVDVTNAGRMFHARFHDTAVRSALPALGKRGKPAVVAVSMDLSRPILGLPGIGQPVELAGLNLAANAMILLDVDPGKGGLAARATTKHIPVENREKGADANGDERPDWPFPDNTRSMTDAQGQAHCKFEVWALDLGQAGADAADRIAYKVTHQDGSSGWVAQCPYEGGENLVLWLDANEDDAVDSMLYVSLDGNADDDKDGKQDAMVYAHSCLTKKHVGEHLQDSKKVAGHTREHDGAHAKFTELEWWP